MDLGSEASKRPAEVPVDALFEAERPQAAASVPAVPTGSSPSSRSPSATPHETMTMTREELQAIVDDPNDQRHPLIKIQAMAELDNMAGGNKVHDHGSWDGRWPLPSRTDREVVEALSFMRPMGCHEIQAAQTARREYRWNSIKDSDKPAFRDAAKKGWEVWTDNDAVEVLSKEASERVIASLRAKGEFHRLLQPRGLHRQE